MILSDLPPMVYAGRVNCVTGYGGAARHQIRVLRQHGLRLKIVDTGSAADPDPSRRDAFVQGCRRSDGAAYRPRGSFIHMGPNCTRQWRARLPRPHVLVSVWETTRLPAEWVEIANTFDQVWCATQWQADVYVASGVSGSKVRFVPFALDPALYPARGPTLAETDALRAEGYFVFGSMFQWTERKAPAVLLGGFLDAFREAGSKAALVLKAYEGDDPGTSVQHHIDRITLPYREAGGTAPIKVITRRLTHSETLTFYRGLDCYVSAHRGEGFGLPIAEALLLGKPVIATDWSAPAEYAKGLYAPVAYTLEPPHSMDWQPFYLPDQEWAAPDQASLAAQMRAAFVDVRAITPSSEAVSRTLHSLPRRAGEAARAALIELTARRR